MADAFQLLHDIGLSGVVEAVEVYVRKVFVLGVHLLRVSTGKGAEKGVGHEAGDLLLGH